jgi:anti-anti-sigma factor
MLTLNTDRGDDGKPVLIASGEIDLSNVDAFAQALATSVAETADSGGTLTVDLSAVEYLDSAAINALFAHAERLHIVAQPLMIRVFAVSGLSELATVEPAPPKAGR